MTTFRTDLKYNENHPPIKREHQLLFSGSCFAENLGEKLVQLKYDAVVNTHGVIFNPIPLLYLFIDVLKDKKRHKDDFFINDGLYRNFSGSSKLSNPDLRETILNWKRADEELKNKLLNANHLFITAGTAFLYRKRENKAPVANCHKRPSDTFTKSLAEVSEMCELFTRFENLLREKNPNINIIITVSPVRHLRDGMIENNRSKARLIEWAHQTADNSGETLYWPAYEYLMDDLRDYRFYNEDMIHPSKSAINYIWNQFSNCFFTQNDRGLNKELNKLIFNAGLRKNDSTRIEKIKLLEKKYKIDLEHSLNSL